MAAMVGVAIIVIVLVVVIPVGIMMSGAVGAAIIGHFLRTDSDHRYEGSELLELNG